MNKPFVITIVGAESSGKTTLAMRLAEHFACPWVPEYAREYLLSLGRPYNEADLEIIAEKQLETILSVVNRQSSAVSRQSIDLSAPDPLKGALVDITSENQYLEDLLISKIKKSKSKIQNPESKILFVDGGMLNLRMWAKIKYGKSIPIVEKALMEDVTDLYLLCRPRSGWTPDPLREAPSLLDRTWIYNTYLEELVKGKKAFELIRKGKKKQFNSAVQIIESYYSESYVKNED